MDFNEHEVVLQTERGMQAWAWKDFSSFLETPFFFHLYFNPRSFFLVPKDAFADLESLQLTRELLRSKLGKIRESMRVWEYGSVRVKINQKSKYD